LSELDAIYSTAPIGLALFDPIDFRYLRLNDRQAEIIGLPKDQILGKTVTEIAPIDGLREMFEQVAKGEPVRNRLLEGELPTRPTEHRYWTVNYDPIFSADGKVEAISAASLEITAQKRAELALIQNEKLAAAGRLAASVAHEINNPLESVTNLLYLIEHGESLNQVRDYARSAQAELARVALVTMQTLRFHRQSTSPTHVKVSDVLDSVAMLYEVRLTGSAIKVSKRYRDEPIVCFESEVRQVLNNLVSNALDAMRSGGELLLRTNMVIERRQGRPGVRITVADTGHGMDAETQRRIFEPFFTTKGLTGTGLGLWVSAEILKRHSGSIKVRSSRREGCHGTVFQVFLPMAYTR
jgi:PAS domain S-box-containing protein